MYIKNFQSYNEKYENKETSKLSFLSDFIQKFNMYRNKNRRDVNPDLYAKAKNKDLFHDNSIDVYFLDEYNLERIKSDWGKGIATPQKKYGEEEKTTVRYDGFRNPEIGDLIIQFRGYGYLYKINSYTGNYEFDSSAAWNQSTPNSWDDILYFDNFAKSYVIKIRPEEVPLRYKKKLAKKIRSTTFDKGTGYKKRNKIETESGYKFESKK